MDVSQYASAPTLAMNFFKNNNHMNHRPNSNRRKSESLEKSRRLIKEAKELIDKFYENHRSTTTEEDAADLKKEDFTKINSNEETQTSGEHDV